jgi:hypothetical protein
VQAAATNLPAHPSGPEGPCCAKLAELAVRSSGALGAEVLPHARQRQANATGQRRERRTG